MATAQALNMDVASLFGAKRAELVPASDISDEPNNTPAETPGQEPENRSSAVDLAAEAGSDEPEFPDEPTGPGTEQEDLFKEKTLVIEQYMTSYKEALDVTSKNGKNPYVMAQEELANSNATIESRNSMIERLRTWLHAKGHKV